jgi:NCS1 family nucleobase:cation symporter-1
MIHWKIIHSASNLLTFMSALAIVLAPIAAIMAADYWVVRRGSTDVHALFQSHGRYRYEAGFNWRAAAAMLVSLAPNIPGDNLNPFSNSVLTVEGMAQAVNPKVKIGGLLHVYDINYLYGFFVAFFAYATLSLLFPATETLIEKRVLGEVHFYTGKEVVGGDVEKNPKGVRRGRVGVGRLLVGGCDVIDEE